jgi:hypothetical protein
MRFTAKKHPCGASTASLWTADELVEQPLAREAVDQGTPANDLSRGPCYGVRIRLNSTLEALSRQQRSIPLGFNEAKSAEPRQTIAV